MSDLVKERLKNIDISERIQSWKKPSKKQRIL
jgi:hypothetical protein